MGHETAIELSQEEIVAIDIEIAVDTKYLQQYTHQAKVQTQTQCPTPPFNLFLLPPELRAMVIDELVHSTIATATVTTTTTLLTTNQTCPNSIFTNLTNSPSLWKYHEAWLGALSTLRNVVAADLEFAARVFDSIGRLQPTAKTAWAERQRDDCLSELLHAARLQLCESHALQILRLAGTELRVFQKRPGMRRDLWRKAPGPSGEGRVRAAWMRLYGGLVETRGLGEFVESRRGWDL